MRIRWTSDAANDLEHIFHYIRRDNPIAARDVIRTITDGIANLRKFPKLGRPGQVKDTRELSFPSLPYIVIYRIKDESIEILRAYHAAQDWP